MLIISRNRAAKSAFDIKSLSYRKMDVFLMGYQKSLLILKCKFSKTDWQNLTDKSVFR